MTLDTHAALTSTEDFRARLAAFVARCRAYATRNGWDPDAAECYARHYATEQALFGRLPRLS